MTNENMTKTEEKKDILRAPLQSGQSEIVYDEIDDKGIAEDVINIIEHTITSSDELNKFNLIVEALSPLIQDKAKLIVSKLYLYKRRPCKFGNSCKEPKCIFIHEKDKIKTQDNKRKVDVELGKRIKRDFDSGNNRDVVVNHINLSQHTESDIIGYISQFGEIENYKKLNDSKWLIVFTSTESAKHFVSSREPILEDNCIKKYFNIMENKKKNELFNLLDKQEEILKNIESNSNELEELRGMIPRIRTLVKEIDEQNIKENTRKMI